MGIDLAHYNAIKKDVKKELEIAWLTFKCLAEKAKGGTLTLNDIEKAERLIGRSIDLSNDFLNSIDEYEDEI